MGILFGVVFIVVGVILIACSVAYMSQNAGNQNNMETGFCLLVVGVVAAYGGKKILD